MEFMKIKKHYFKIHTKTMAYSDKEKLSLLEILENNDFDIKNSVIEYNKLSTHKLERKTVYNWLENDDLFKQRFDFKKNELLDESERMHRILRLGIPIKDTDTNEIIAWQEKPDRAAIEFFLKTKGKDRGYIEINKTDITTNGKDIEIPIFKSIDLNVTKDDGSD